MIATALLGWAALLAVTVPALLRRAAWTERAPRLGVLVWQAASGSMLAALVLDGLALAVPVTALSGGLADLLTNCVMAVRDAYRTPVGGGAAGAGLVLSGTVIARIGHVAARDWRRTARRRRAHAEAIVVLGRRDRTLGVVVVDHPAPAAYAVPGRRRRIVVTTGAVTTLDDQQLAAVLAHERAHLAARHHLAVAAAAALAGAFPRVPLLREAAAAVPRLVEMAADDAAGSRADRARVADALVALADAAVPVGALAAGGPTALARVRRLVRPAAPLPRASAAAVLASAGLLLVAPAGLALAPAAVAGPMPHCTMAMPT